MDTNPETVELALKQALEWLERLKAAQPGEHAAFLRWLKTSPVHVREMLIAAECDRALAGIDADRTIDVAALLADGLCNVVPLYGEASELKAASPRVRRAQRIALSAWRARSWKIAAGLAFIALGVFGAWAIESRSTEREIVTDVGEWQTEVLADGTRLRISPETRLAITLDETERTIDLASGEAYFEVARDPARPFKVRTATAEARALGTRFAVRARADVVSVSVSEGLVAVERIALSTVDASRPNVPSAREAVRLGAGQQVIVTAHAPLSVEAPDARLRIDWTRGVVHVEGARLRTLVDELNERNEHQIHLIDPALNDRRVFGAFSVADPISFVQFLHRSEMKAVELRERKSTASTSPPRRAERAADQDRDVN